MCVSVCVCGKSEQASVQAVSKKFHLTSHTSEGLLGTMVFLTSLFPSCSGTASCGLKRKFSNRQCFPTNQTRSVSL